jgi:multisubunit Na+/H+ antiporter MnhB subunit
MTAWLVFDLVLVVTIVGTAWAALAARDTFTAIVLFMVMGLMLAVAWARLDAPDVALAEAAVGAGLTGAALFAAGAGGLLAIATLALPQPPVGLDAEVAARLADSGVGNPVTAVLLNFRAYDTMLEVLVLFASVVLVWNLGGLASPASRGTLGPIFLTFARLGLPVLVIVSGYLLWIGAFAPGGAFQAGALLAASLVLLMVGGSWRPRARDRRIAAIAVPLGAAGLGVAAIAAWLLGGAVLQYPAAAAKTWIIAIEALIAISTAVTLAGLFHGLAAGGRRT